ncbi:MAG: Ig-like domain-containing protein [Isosphaeraceae bacterium]|nr:Ig-like domain-containing protein [Isosphaeraceae bacterium]
MAAAVLAAAALLAAAPADGPVLRWNAPAGEETRATVEVLGLDRAALDKLAAADLSSQDWSRFFAALVADGDKPSEPSVPILGSYRIEGEVLRFSPRFPLERGSRYLARFDPSLLPAGAARLGLKPLSAVFQVPERAEVASTVVEQVYPTADTVPENLLKLYLHFSAPMSRGEVYDRIHLFDASGREVPHPFLELGEELWDPSGRRLTLLFEPGRIKRGLKPREEAGPILLEGRTYTLVIDRAWPDAEGRSLGASFHKTFRVGPPDDRQPDPKGWRIGPPSAGTTAPLTITFPEPLDRAMLGRALTVTDAQGRPVPGSVAIENHETRWRFSPERPWQEADYRIVVATSLEDLAGNSIARPFEVDVFDKVDRRIEAEMIAIPLTISHK